jgi:hypothetical protein
MDDNWMARLSEASVLFQQSGPFFISLLFLLIGSTVARNAYQTVCQRKEPPPTEKETGTYRAWFIFSFAFGSALTLAGVVYWYKHEPIYVFSGVIQNLNSSQTLWGDHDAKGTVYIHRIPLGSDVEGEKRDDEFLIVRQTPFREGEMFALHFLKTREDGAATRIEKLPLSYSATPPELEIRWNPATGKNELVPINANLSAESHKTSMSLSLIAEAKAETMPPPALMDIQRPVAMSANQIVDALQGDRVYVGTEISALDTMLRLSNSDRVALVANDGMTEPMVVTLLDLTRHGDPELSYKAKQVLAGANAAAIFRKNLLDAKAATRTRYSAALYRIPTTDALALLNSIPKLPAEAAAAKKRITSNWTPRLLAASPTSSGDRYWFVALSSRGNTEKMISCVSEKISGDDFIPMAPTTGQAIFTLAGTEAEVDNWMLALSGAYGKTRAFYMTSFQTAFNNAGKALGYNLPDSTKVNNIIWKCSSSDSKTNTCTSTIVNAPDTFIVKRNAGDRTKLTVSIAPGVSGYSHSKGWVLHAADVFEGCGATVSFSQP